MSPRIMKHNPAFLSREELVSSFVTRQEDLAFVLEHLAENTGASSQHLLIVAPRGMGKTTLVLRTAEAVRTEERFSKAWFPLVYAEETYEVTSAGELWLEGLRHLGEQTGNSELLGAYRELRREKDEQRLYDRALGLLLQFADGQKKRLLLVVENLHMLLGEQISKADAWRLRKTLQTERRLALLATATASFEAIENVEQAFFDQFRTYRLEPLDLEGARQVWAHVAGASVPAEQMRPLHILTGGNPRLLTILASFAGGMSLRALMGDLVRLVDDHTTYFKSNLESLPAKERKVYVALADLWQPSTAREVAEQARMSPSEASALLNRLTQRGAVTASGDERRRVYQLAERMYNIYHLLRRSGGDDSRVRAIVDFMVGFYDPVSLGKVVRAIAEEGKQLGEDERRDHLLVMESLLRREANPRIRELWANEAKAHVESWRDTPASLRKELGRISSERWHARIKRAGFPVEEVNSLLRSGREVIGALRDAGAEEIDLILQPLMVGDELLAASVGVYLELATNDDRAASLLRRGLEGRHLAPRRAVLAGGLGRCLWRLGHREEAEGLLREAIDLAPQDPGYLANLAFALAEIAERSTEAEELARRAIELDPGAELAWRALFMAFRKMSESDLRSRASLYQPMLRAKGVSRHDRAVAGLWSLALGSRSGELRTAESAVRTLRRAWQEGSRSMSLSLLLLLVTLESGRCQESVEPLAELASSLDPWDVERAFGAIWTSDKHSMHAVTIPHLPVLLADESLGRARLPLVGLLLALARWDEARTHLATLLAPGRGGDASKPDEKALQYWTQIFTDAAATGHAREALDLLVTSPLATWLEPVVVGLHAYLGEPYRAPMEVREVGNDVVERMRQRAIALRVDATEPAHPAEALPGVVKASARGARKRVASEARRRSR